MDPDENVDVNSVFSISSKMQKSDGEVSVQANDILHRWTLSTT